MKAEQRKQLESNVLAERMGRAAHTLQTPPDRKAVRSVALSILGAVVVLGASAAVYLWFTNQWSNTSKAWRVVYEGNPKELAKEVLKEEPNTTEQDQVEAATTAQGKAVLFQFAWRLLWDLGVQRIGANPEGGFASVEAAEKRYEQLLEICKDEPMWASEALYGLALAKETLALKVGMEAPNLARKEAGKAGIFNPSQVNERVNAKISSMVDARLKEAKELWADLDAKYGGKTIWGSKGTKRLQVYLDRTKYERMKEFYVDYCRREPQLSSIMKMQMQMQMGGLGGMQGGNPN